MTLRVEILGVTQDVERRIEAFAKSVSVSVLAVQFALCVGER
ncbi:hypothetical protein [Mycobacteroides chelonae]|nr:hypothetical protein [Mycobacteroides chelonae]